MPVIIRPGDFEGQLSDYDESRLPIWFLRPYGCERFTGLVTLSITHELRTKDEAEQDIGEARVRPLLRH